MDGKKYVGETFANIYQNLYKSADDKDKTPKLLGQVNGSIGDSSTRRN